MLKRCQMDAVFRLCSQLACEIKDANTRLIDDNNGLDPVHVVDLTTDLVCNELGQVKTNYKRNQLYASDQLYVPLGWPLF